MTPEILSGAAAILLSLIFSYVPGLNTWYAALKSEWKSLIMLGLLFVIAGVAFGLACAGWLEDLTGLIITCDKPGILGLLRTFVIAVVVNAGMYIVSPETPAVKAAKEARE
jgi:hypothetical protein